MTRRNLVTALLFASFVSLIVACGGSNGGVVPGPVQPAKVSPSPSPSPTPQRREFEQAS